MAKDRIERDELASKLIETASSAEDPLRAMAELLTVKGGVKVSHCGGVKGDHLFA